MAWEHGVAEAVKILVTVTAKRCLRSRPWPMSEIGHELVDGLLCGLNAFSCQMGIEGRGSWTRMSEYFLDEAQIDTAFKEMGGVRMPERMDSRAFADAALSDNDPEGPLERRIRDDRLSVWAWKEEGLWTLCQPVVPKEREGPPRKGNVSILAPLSPAYVDEHAITVDGVHCEMCAFGKAQATGIDRGERHALCGLYYL